jgi:fluoride ion exporter CrcB/FEX
MSFYQYILVGMGGDFGAILRVVASRMLPEMLMQQILPRRPLRQP